MPSTRFAVQAFHRKVFTEQFSLKSVYTLAEYTVHCWCTRSGKFENSEVKNLEAHSTQTLANFFLNLQPNKHFWRRICGVFLLQFAESGVTKKVSKASGTRKREKVRLCANELQIMMYGPYTHTLNGIHTVWRYG